MIVELQTRHWLFMLVLAAIQVLGLGISVSRSAYAPAITDFLRNGGWFGLMIPISFVFSSAFTTTVVLTELMKAFRKRK